VIYALISCFGLGAKMEVEGSGEINIRGYPVSRPDRMQLHGFAEDFPSMFEVSAGFSSREQSSELTLSLR
jgi:hypothetical protein